MLSSQIPQLYITQTEKGRGVFTALDISAQSIIENCPVIILDKREKLLIHQTKLHDYYFVWDMAEESCAIALGFGSIYNHSETPNAEFEILKAELTIRFISNKPIKAGEEITINYINIEDKRFKLWF